MHDQRARSMCTHDHHSAWAGMLHTVLSSITQLNKISYRTQSHARFGYLVVSREKHWDARSDHLFRLENSRATISIHDQDSRQASANRCMIRVTVMDSVTTSLQIIMDPQERSSHGISDKNLNHFLYTLSLLFLLRSYTVITNFKNKNKAVC